MANLTDADKVLRNDTGKSIATNIASIVTALSGSDTLSGLSDVSINSATLANGQVFQYNGTTGKWINDASPTAKQLEVTQEQYDALVSGGTVDPTIEYFIKDANVLQSIAINDLTDVTVSGLTLTNGQTITWDSTSGKWINYKLTAGDIPLGSTTPSGSTAEAINKASSDSSITFTPADTTKVSLTSLTAYKNGATLIINMYLTANTEIPANSEWRIGDFSGTNAGLGAISGVVVNRADSGLLGSYCFTTGNQRLYTTMNTNVASGTNLYLTIVTFTA